MSETPLFSPRLVVAIFVLGALLLGAAIWVQVAGSERADDFGPSPASTSAIGYQGIVRLLRALDHPVRVIEALGGRGARHGDLLVLPEPGGRDVDLARLEQLLSRGDARNLLVVLPKWQGVAHPLRDGWVGGIRPRHPEVPARVLALFDPEAELVRTADLGAWRRLGPLPDAPVLPAPQLVRSSLLAPVVANEAGLLLGRLATPQGIRWLLTDPDLLSNHGLRRQADPAVPVALLRAMVAGRGRIDFLDPSPTALGQPTSLLNLLFEFPMVIVTAELGLAALMLLWAAAARFGRPQRPERALPPGKQALVENGAALLRFVGHHGSVAQRYFDMAAALAAERLHAPRGLEREQQLAWLGRIAATRGLARDGLALRGQIAAETGKPIGAGRALALARMTDRWRRELLDEPG